MSTKVKRGLGLLVVAVIALGFGNAFFRVANAQDGGALYSVLQVLGAVSTLAFAASLLGGLGLLAWGLLRD